jgi:hypothetical protein
VYIDVSLISYVLIDDLPSVQAGQAVGIGGRSPINRASFLRFAQWRRAEIHPRQPVMPRNRSRRKFKLRFRWANNISIFRRSRAERSNASVPLSGAKWSWLKAWGVRVAQRRGMRRAIVAVAKRLAVIL